MGPQRRGARCATSTSLLDVHLMVEAPERHVEDFAEAGADNITVHAEATPHVHNAVQAIREAGCTRRASPSTRRRRSGVFGEVRGDLVALCMTVNPGWGGQAFIPASLDKIRRLRALVGDDVELEVDGGIDARHRRPVRRGRRDALRGRHRRCSAPTSPARSTLPQGRRRGRV